MSDIRKAFKEVENFRSTKDIATLIKYYYESPMYVTGTIGHLCVEQRLLSYKCHTCILYVCLKCSIFAKVIRRLV
jgi:hypothetical protein